MIWLEEIRYSKCAANKCIYEELLWTTKETALRSFLAGRAGKSCEKSLRWTTNAFAALTFQRAHKNNRSCLFLESVQVDVFWIDCDFWVLDRDVAQLEFDY